jgi:transcriptional regulator with XRE-family HTH domain
MPHVTSADFKKQVGDRLRRTREALEGRPSQAKLAKKLEITKSRWNNYERGVRMLDPDIAVALCDKYELTLDWLYRGDPRRLPTYLSQGIDGMKDVIEFRRAGRQ